MKVLLNIYLENKIRLAKKVTTSKIKDLLESLNFSKEFLNKIKFPTQDYSKLSERAVYYYCSLFEAGLKNKKNNFSKFK